MKGNLKGFGELLSFLKLHWGKLLLIVVLGKPLFFLFIILSAFVIAEGNKNLYNEASNANSAHIGRNVRIAPFAFLGRRTNYSGWNDKYLYIFATTPKRIHHTDPVETIAINDYTIFKVIDVKGLVGGFLGGRTREICILQNIADLKQIATEDCDELDAVEELTHVYSEAEADINEFGSAYISFKKMGSVRFKRVLDVNSFSIFKISSKQELVSLLQENLGSFDAYKYIVGLKEPYILKKEELQDERKIALLLKTNGFAESWESKKYGDTKFYTYLNKNGIPDDIENWISLNYSSSHDRWVLRTLTSFLQRMILNQHEMSAHDAKNNLALFEEVTQCLRVYFTDYSNYSEHINALKVKFLKTPDRLLKYENIIDRSRDFGVNKFKYYPNGCSNFSPPTWMGF